jgi:tetratricopeptide (TPR) repeat protein
MPRADRHSERSLARAEARAREAREHGLRESNGGRPAVAARYLRAGLRQLGWAEDGSQPDEQQVLETHHALASRLLIILAGTESLRGRTEYGLRLLDRAEGLVPADLRGILLTQRGRLFVRTWRLNDALKALDEAVALLEGNPAETYNLASALLNRCFAHLNAADVRRARPDAIWSHQVAADGGHDMIAAKALHDLGYCDLLAGDIPAALRLFNAAASGYQVSAPGFLPVLAMDKARALLAAGLAGDAAGELDSAMDSFLKQRLDYDLAEAELARAEAALAVGEPATARRWAAAAERRFRRQDNEACAYVAELTQLRARSLSPGHRAPAAQALLLAERLRGRGLANDADLAELLAARMLLAAGRTAEARRLIAVRHRRRQAVPLTVSLLRRLARAELAEREGRPGMALAELRAGLGMVQAQRGRLGSVDLRTGTAALGADLAAAGLRLALDRNSARLVFAWLERSRAQAFRVRPVRPPADPRAAAVLAELRQLSRLIRTAELNGTRDPPMTARHAELQREVRELGWQTSGLGEATAQASLGEVSAALEETGQSLAGILARQGQLLAVVVGRGSVRLVRLGDFETAAEAARRLNADLDTLAGRRLPGRLEAVIKESVRFQMDVLTAEIMEPLRSALGEGGVVLVPVGSLAGIPWSMLPDLRGRSVTVCPSASSWLAARRRGRAAAAGPRPGPPLLVAGPDLEHADREVTEIAKSYPGCRPLLADAATVNAALQGLDGAPLAHLAAHGHHDRENFLFSRLDLADGPLMAYDIQQLAAAPQHVVLSSCDVGRTVVRPGEEILGFTAALLYVGTVTVISSVTKVADDAAVATMTRYHRLLSAGARPAEALAEAALPEQFSPFVCFGSG